MIYKFRNDGLCSRLLHLWHISYLHKTYKQKIDCIWNKNFECDIDFHDLFVVQDFFSVRSARINKEPTNFHGVFKDSQFIWGNEFQDVFKRPPDTYPFYADAFKLQPHIISEFKELKIKYNITNKTLGYHIRGMETFGPRGANITQKDVSNLVNSIMSQIESVIQENKDKQILISSDDPKIEQQFLKKYPNNCFVIEEDKKPTHMLGPQNTGRDRDSISKAFILLLLLSETDYRATFGSVFSKFPDHLKLIRKVNDFLI